MSITREETRHGKCPFCECQTTKNDRINADHVAIWCPKCGVTMDIPQGRMSYNEALNVLYGKWYSRPIEDALQARIAELERKPIQCPRCGDPITNEMGDNPICGACALTSELNVKTLQARIAELEKTAIVWHKYPDEKPLIDGRYLFWDSDGNAPHVLPHNDIVVRDNPGVFSTQTHWAYLPEPPEVKG